MRLKVIVLLAICCALCWKEGHGYPQSQSQGQQGQDSGPCGPPPSGPPPSGPPPSGGPPHNGKGPCGPPPNGPRPSGPPPSS